MNTRASKAQAIKLIKSAMAAGFTRKVEAYAHAVQKPYCVMVSLGGHFQKGLLNAYAFLTVSFRQSSLRKASSVAVSTLVDYDKESRRGLWQAQQAVNYIAELKAKYGQHSQQERAIA